MYKKKFEYCGKEFNSQQPNAKYCGKYCGGKARNLRKLINKMKRG